MSEFNLDNSETNETKGWEPASQEQLAQILALVEELTAELPLESPNEAESYRRMTIVVTPHLSVELMRPQGQMAEDIAVATVYFDWHNGDKKVTRAITLEQDASDKLSAATHWEVDPDNLADIIELGAAPGRFKEHLDQMSRQDYENGARWQGIFNVYNKSQPLSADQARGVIDFLVDHAELEKNGLREGDICTWTDPETGVEHTVLIYRGERRGWIKHKAMYYMMSEVAPGEDWQAKKVDWHDITVADTEGDQYVLHSDTNYGWVLRADTKKNARLAGDTSEEAIHQLYVPIEQVPPEAQIFYEDWREGDMGTAHADAVRTAANRIAKVFEETDKDRREFLPEEFEQVIAQFCRVVAAELKDFEDLETEFKEIRASSWEKYINGQADLTAFEDVLIFCKELFDHEELIEDVPVGNEPGKPDKETIWTAGNRLFNSLYCVAKPAGRASHD